MINKILDMKIPFYILKHVFCIDSAKLKEY